MDLTTNELYKQIKKKEKNNLITNTKPIISSLIIKTKPKKVESKKIEDNNEKYFMMIILNECNISHFIYNSSLNQKIRLSFNNLEYLSLTNNYLMNLNFITNLPELFYLDVFGNPLEDFETLNNKNIFGYLRLTVENFHEKKLLAVNGLICSILKIDIKDKAILRLFKINNPCIIMLNNEILYYIDFLIEAELKTKTKRLYNIDSNENSINKSNADKNNIININTNIHINNNNNKYQSQKNINLRFIKKKINQFQEQNIPENLKLNKINTNIKITNKNLLAVKTFFVELNEIITKLTKKAKGRLKPQHLSGEKLYLNIEKKRILLLYQIYMKLNIFNERKKKNIDYIYIKNMDVINSNKFCDEIKIYEIKQYIKCININIRFGIIILISILFYCLNLVSMKMAITIIHYLLLKYYKFDEHKQFQYFNTFGNIHYLCYYLDNLEDFKTKLKFAEKGQIELYHKILELLEVPKLILKLNKLEQKKNFFNSNKNISQKNRVSYLLSDINELKIEKEIFILIEFFCDFIQYEDIEQKIINSSENDEYSTLIEIKELLEQNELERNNLYVQDLSVKKFYKNKLESTFNKFFFENEKIKIVKNKIFNYSHEKKKNFIKNKLNLISFFYNWNQEYKKADEISTENCFTIDKYIAKGRSNNNIINNKIKTFKNIEYTREISDFSNEKKNANKENNLTRNVFSNKNLKNKLNININQEQNIYFKTENNNINAINKNYRIKERETLGKIYKNIIEMKSTKNLLNTNRFFDDSKKQKQNEFKLLSNYFDKNKFLKYNFKETNKNKFLKIYLLKKNPDENILRQKYNSEEGRYYNNNKIRLKNIKGKETPHISINAFRLYDKTKNIKRRTEMHDIFDDDLFVEKYNQARQSKIIRKIIEKQDKIFQDRLKKSKNIVPFNK